VYRIDHYIHKKVLTVLENTQTIEEIQSLMSQFIVRSIEVRIHETVDVDDRGAFYDKYGAIRDVIQNHGLEMAIAALALCEVPSVNSRVERAQLASSITKVLHVRRAQYDGYNEIAGVSPDSATETYADVILETNQGIQIRISAGKALNKSLADIRITTDLGTLCIELQPNAHIEWLGQNIDSLEIINQNIVALVARLNKEIAEIPNQDAYYSVFKDALMQDFSRSISHEEILQLWRITDAIRAVPSNTEIYTKGSATA
jgi:glucose-6-phosphate 1-dehydrogenase